MKRFLSVLILSLFVVPTVFATDSFSDVDDNFVYSNGIEYLRANGVVEGYPDGSFKPLFQINRAEMAKIVVESVGVDLVDPNDCFPDVPSSEWYATYVCTAKTQGWVEGYPDGSFQPAREINRAEAVKIIAEAESWNIPVEYEPEFNDTPLDQWYTGYISFAKNKNFLPFTSKFKPGNAIKRGEFSEIYYRVLYARNENLDQFVSPNGEDVFEVEEVDLDDLDVEVSESVEVDLGAASYGSNVFDGLSLEEDFPKTFFENEVYRFEGELTSGNYDSIFAFVYEVGDEDDVETFVSEVDNGEFSISVYFRETGQFNIGIIPGSGGTSKIARLTVDNVPTVDSSISAPDNPDGVSVRFEDGKTIARYSSEGNINKVTFSKGDEKVVYVSRQAENEIALDYKDFKYFTEGQVSWKVETANTNDDDPFLNVSRWEDSSSETFSAVTHHFSEVEDDIDLDELPIFYDRGVELTLSGETFTDLSGTFYAILPNGNVYSDKVTTTIDSGDDFSFDYTPSDSGTHILEINTTAGLAVLNHPIYQRGKIPLIPDFFDLNQLELLPNLSFNEGEELNDLLDYINEARDDHGLDPVQIDGNLSDLAREHAQDMMSNNFFAHVNLSGESPNDRRVDAGISTHVGENIAKSTGTDFAHEALMRSAVHRINILTPDWTRVGLSVLRDSEGYFYVVQEFSTTISSLVSDVEDAFNDERSSDLDIDSKLEGAAQEWTDLMLEEDFFATEYEGDRVFDHIADGHGFSDIRVLLATGGKVSTLVELGLENSEIENAEWTDAGYGIGVHDDGTIYLTVVYAK